MMPGAGATGAGGLRFAAVGAVAGLSSSEEDVLLDRGTPVDGRVERTVAEIVASVRERGDEALRELARRFDGVELEALEVPSTAWDEALDGLDDPLRAALRLAARRIGEFHRAQLPAPLEVEVGDGVRVGRRAEPLRRVGVYAPGGRAAYPSSVLMGVVPARIAGVDRVVVCSPPGPDGRPPATVLAACAVGGADRVFALGGAGAIAAMAYGTASVPRVDKVVGPGNVYVNEAKRQLTGAVAIDTPAGPSELLVVADDTADPERIALELLAQAEHDPEAAVALVATSDDLVGCVRRVLEDRVRVEPRRSVIEAALASRGALLTAADESEALAFAERYAPEHVLLLVREPRRLLDRVRAAGTVFLGEASSVAFGDYMTGANHVLPTGGLARAYAGLSTGDFQRESTYQELSPAAAAALAGPTAVLADAEGLPAHAAAARARATLEPATNADVTESENDGRARVRSGRRREPSADRGKASTAPAAVDAGVVDGRGASVPLRPAYRDLSTYDPGRRPVEIDLSDNTNLFGPHPAALRALESLSGQTVSRYPSVYADRLRMAIAGRHGVAPENVVSGCGSDDVIDAAVRAFCDPGHVVAFPVPTFGVVAAFARMNAARPAGVPLGADFALDPDALAAAGGRITYVCRPNNPTGTVPDAGAIERLARGVRGVVLVDEAYAEFAGESLAGRAAASDRLVVVRTFSKAYGLAGLRVGYAIGPARVIAEIRKARGPYKVARPAEAAAIAALDADRGWLDEIVARTRENRDRTAAALAERGLACPPSAANFVLVRCPDGRSAHDLADGLRACDIGVRPFEDLPGIGDAIRVTIGPWPLMERFIAGLDNVLDPGNARRPGPTAARRARTGRPAADRDSTADEGGRP